MVKRAHVLANIEDEAGIPYTQTRLARRAARARPRIAILLAAGSAAFLLEALLTTSAGWGLGALALGLTAWGTWRDKLGGVIAAAFIAILALLVPIRWALDASVDTGARLALGFLMLWAVALLPDVVLLIRDAELQNAYGRWAKRDG